MRPFTFFALTLLFSSCSAVKTMKYFSLLKKGDVQATAFSQKQSFTLSNNFVLLPVIINGESYSFILDTGAPPTVVSTELAAKLNLKTKGSAPVYDSQGNKKDQDIILPDSVNIAGVSFYSPPCIVSDMNGISATLCRKVDGIIGSSLLHNAIWAFDFTDNTVLVTNDKTTLPAWPHAQTIPFTTGKYDLTPVIDISFNGQTLEKYLSFDMGATTGIILGKYVVKHQQEKEHFEYITYSTGNTSMGLHGAGITDTVFYSRLQDVKIGAVSLDEQVVRYKKTGPSVIGMEKIKHFNVILNWKDQELTLSKISEPGITPANALGFNYSWQEEHCMITEIYNNSPAEKAGLQLNDLLVSLNGKKYEGLTETERCSLLNEKINTDQLELVIIRAGKEMKLAFGKYYYPIN